MPNTSPQSRVESTKNGHGDIPHRGNPTLDDPDVHTARRDDYDTAADIIEVLTRQDTRSALDESNCCNSGDQGFRTYKTDLPVIRSEDIEPGLLVYRPTPGLLTAYEFRSEPYVNEHGSRRVDVIAYSRSHSGDDPEIRTHDRSLFVASVVDKMTFLRPETVQETLPTA